MLTTTFGLQAESFVEQLLAAARFRSATNDLTTDQLLDVAKVVDPRRYHKTNQHQRLNRLNSKGILDHLYGVDHLIDLGEEIYVSIDTTVAPSAVAKKIQKAQSLSRLRQGIGIQQHIVLLLVGEFSSFDRNVTAASVNEFWEFMCDAVNGPPNRVRFFRLHVS